MQVRMIACALSSFALLALAPLGCGFDRLPSVHAQTTIFSQMDAASAKFKNAQADVKYDAYTKIVKDHDLSSGSIYIERAGSSDNMGAVITSQGASSPDKILAYGGGTLQIYSPGTNQDDVFKAGANQAKYESFLTLGFGGSGKDMTSQWTVTDQGAETIDGVKTEKLDLLSKDPSVKSMFTHVTLWIDPVRDVSLKQIFYAPNGDMRTTTYSNFRLNEKLDKGKYEISRKAKKIAH